MQGTGPCGINCLVCGLFKQGKCTPCAPGTDPKAQQKLAAQLSILGSTCPILQCAVESKVDHCSADCDRFPCHRFFSGPYPLSQAYLEMHLRRRSKPGNQGVSDGGKDSASGKLH